MIRFHSDLCEPVWGKYSTKVFESNGTRGAQQSCGAVEAMNLHRCSADDGKIDFLQKLSTRKLTGTRSLGCQPIANCHRAAEDTRLDPSCGLKT
jgi:hypothetical protein